MFSRKKKTNLATLIYTNALVFQKDDRQIAISAAKSVLLFIFLHTRKGKIKVIEG